jgi:hypothetical protein
VTALDNPRFASGYAAGDPFYFTTTGQELARSSNEGYDELAYARQDPADRAPVMFFARGGASNLDFAVIKCTIIDGFLSCFSTPGHSQFFADQEGRLAFGRGGASTPGYEAIILSRVCRDPDA